MIKYFNAQTGKEVKYGETFHYHEKKELSKGYIAESDFTLPLINETIPNLIKQGVLIQKEVNEPEVKEDKNPKPELSVHEKLNLLAKSIVSLHDKVDRLTELILEYDD